MINNDELVNKGRDKGRDRGRDNRILLHLLSLRVPS